MPLPYESDIDALTDQPLTPHLESCEFFINDVAYLSHDNRRVSALNRFAQSRCEPLSPEESKEGSCPVRLKSLELHFDRSRWIPKQKVILEGWEDSSYGIGMPRSEYLRSLKHDLHEELPELEWCPHRRSVNYGKKRAGKVKDILNLIEAFDWLDAGEIFISEIHISLKDLSEKGVVADRGGRLGNRAKRILQKWDPVFQRSLPECRWMLRGGHVMIYVTRDDNIRKSPHALKSLVYGVEDHMSYRTAFWPIYMN